MTTQDHIRYDFATLDNLLFRAKYRITREAYSLLNDRAEFKGGIRELPRGFVVDILDGSLTIH